MSFNFRKTGPQIMLTLVIAIFIFEYALPQGPLNGVKNELSLWLTIVAGFTFFVAGITVLLKYSRDLVKMKNFGSTQFYAVEFLVVFFAYIIVALAMGGVGGSTYSRFYTFLQGNLTQAAWVLMVFLEPWAAYKAFQIRSPEALILAITGLTYILFLAPTIPAAFPVVGDFASWIVNVPSKGGIRGATIAMGVGAILLALRMLTAKEKGITD
jgi:hypothetical protein